MGLPFLVKKVKKRLLIAIVLVTFTAWVGFMAFLLSPTMPTVNVSDLVYPNYDRHSLRIQGYPLASPKFLPSLLPGYKDLPWSSTDLIPGSEVTFPDVNRTVYTCYFTVGSDEKGTSYIIVFSSTFGRQQCPQIQLTLQVTIKGYVQYTPESACWSSYCPHEPVAYILAYEIAQYKGH